MNDQRSDSLISKWWIYLPFLILAPTVAHLLFSWLGFNPSDDGFILAGSRRILDGQIPHRDFIAIRPAGSFILHAPFVLLGGKYTFWLSRWFVWSEMAVIAWLGTVTLRRLFRISLPAVVSIGLALLTLCFDVHNFPILAWHSIDALLFTWLGFAAITRERESLKTLGYLLLGCAPLFRQNFLLVPLAGLILSGDWRRWRHWLAMLAPGAVMLVLLLVAGAWSQFWSQLTAQSGLYEAGIKPYLEDVPFRKGAIVGALGVLSLFLAQRRIRPRGWQIAVAVAGVVLLFLTPALAISYLYDGRFAWKPCMRIIGATVGCSALLLILEHEYRRLALPLLFTLFVAWSVSVSIGYQTTALISGALALLLMLTAYLLIDKLEFRRHLRRLGHLLVGLILAFTLIAFVHTRRTDVYRDRAASELTMPVGDVLAGGEMIYTNPRTFAFMADLRKARNMVQKGRYAIIPDFACHWIDSRQPNPLPVDWVQATELSTPALVAQVIDTMETQRGELTVIVEKISARFVARQEIPLPDSDRYSVVNYVKSHWQLAGETKYFSLYR